MSKDRGCGWVDLYYQKGLEVYGNLVSQILLGLPFSYLEQQLVLDRDPEILLKFIHANSHWFSMLNPNCNILDSICGVATC